MAAGERCDVAVWDIDGTLTGELRSLLRSRRRQSGPRLLADIGRWRERSIVVARPPRVTAVELPTLAEALGALSLGHGPQWIAVVGPASAPAGAFTKGQVVCAAGSRSGGSAEPVPMAVFCEGRVDPGVSGAVATDWASAAREAAEGLGIPFDLLAVVTTEATVGEAAVAPKSVPVTRGRAAGRWLGRLLSPSKLSGEAEASRASSASLLSATIGVLIARRTVGER